MAAYLDKKQVTRLLLQAVMTGGIIYTAYTLFLNTQANLAARNIASGFGFLSVEAGLPISNSLLSYNPSDSYGYAFLVGVVNTLYVSLLGILAASAIGVLIGIARVSRNWLISNLAAVYVETLRNIPLLLLLFFAYGVVLAGLPHPRASLHPGWGVYVNNRGFYLPRPIFQDGVGWVAAMCGLALILAILLWRWAIDHHRRTGRYIPAGWLGCILVIGMPALTAWLTGTPLTWEKPVLQGFNFQGGMVLRPEFSALMIGLVLYTAAFIGENVRSGIQAVDAGQIDAARSFGVRPGIIMRRIVLPQALRVIVPATTNDYTSLVKNSSLAVAIGYPDMVSVGGTIIGQNDQAIEIIGMWMAVYLCINLIISTLMNWVNARVQLTER